MRVRQNGHVHNLERKSTWQYGFKTAWQLGEAQRTGSYGKAVGGAQFGPRAPPSAPENTGKSPRAGPHRPMRTLPNQDRTMPRRACLHLIDDLYVKQPLLDGNNITAEVSGPRREDNFVKTRLVVRSGDNLFPFPWVNLECGVRILFQERDDCSPRRVQDFDEIAVGSSRTIIHNSLE